MTAKHHAPHPRRRQKPDDLERRVRRIERNYAKDAARIARAVARGEIEEAVRLLWMEGKVSTDDARTVLRR